MVSNRALLLSVGIASTGLFVVWFEHREPRINGKPVTYWVNRITGLQPHEESQRAMREIGPKAIPFLLNWARTKNSISERAYQWTWPRLPAVLQRRLAPPRRLDFMRQDMISYAIGEMGPSALPQLIPALDDRDQGVRLAAVGAIGHINPPSDQAAQAVVKLLKDPNAYIRTYALCVLASGSKPLQSIPAFIDALKDSDKGPNPGDTAGVRGCAASILGEIGPEARAALPELRNLLGDENTFTRMPAAVALWRIDHDATMIPLLIEELRQATNDPMMMIRGMTAGIALKAFGEMGILGKAAVPTIIWTITNIGEFEYSDETNVLHSANEALIKVDPEAAARIKPIQ